jgi:hypothetical protein
MAQTIYCTSDDGQVAAFLLTNIAEGETLALCQTCFNRLAVDWVSNLEAAMSAAEAAADAPATEPEGESDGVGADSSRVSGSDVVDSGAPGPATPPAAEAAELAALDALEQPQPPATVGGKWPENDDEIVPAEPEPATFPGPVEPPEPPQRAR